MSEEVRRQIVALLPRLRRFAFSLTRSRADADDLVQSACEKALSRLHQFEPGTRLDSWMFRIAHTVFIDRQRQQKVRSTMAIDETAEVMGFDARTHERTEAREALAIVRGEIERLPDEQRVLIAMVAIDGMSYQQAAETLEIPIGTVMSRLARARRKLADALEQPRAAGAREA
jgi:RNA polymerase sigma-70 factor (ECF subfamily)